jgi:hypothetical protein
MFKQRSEMIDKCQVKIVDLTATYIRSAESRLAAILDGTDLCGVEEFAARQFRRSGFDAIILENTPFHVLFGVYMWMLIQDPRDPRVRMVAFGDRHAYDQRLPSKLIWTGQPQWSWHGQLTGSAAAFKTSLPSCRSYMRSALTYSSISKAWTQQRQPGRRCFR